MDNEEKVDVTLNYQATVYTHTHDCFLNEKNRFSLKLSETNYDSVMRKSSAVTVGRPRTNKNKSGELILTVNAQEENNKLFTDDV